VINTIRSDSLVDDTQVLVIKGFLYMAAHHEEAARSPAAGNECEERDLE